MSYLEQKTSAYWEASSGFMAPIAELTEYRRHKDELWRLVGFAPSYRLRANSLHTLSLRHAQYRFCPAPNGGDAA